MPRSSVSSSRSSSASASSTFRLRAPPARPLGTPIATVLRGHRFVLRFGKASRCYGIGIPQSSPTAMESYPSLSPLAPGPRGFVHTYHTVTKSPHRDAQPTIEESPSYIVARTPPRQPSSPDVFYILNGSMGSSTTHGSCYWSQPSLPADCDAEDGTHITHFALGKGSFRPVDPIGLDIPIFSWPMANSDFTAPRVQIDPFDGLGLTSGQFRDMFGRCEGCQRFMMRRSKNHHQCPGITAGAQGLTVNQFRYLFVSCVNCRHIFTRMTGASHVHYDC